jgi:hypothetical protein
MQLDLSGLQGRSHTLDVHTCLIEPGLLLRIEQDARHRAAGTYRSNWPELQLRAAQHYMLAAREILRSMHLPQVVSEQKEGRICILGFETNNVPHNEFPPHWHLIAEWPHFFGAVAPHLYLDDVGRNVKNRVSVNGSRAKADYATGEWCCLKGYTGNDILALRVDADGSLAITAPHQPIYSLLYTKDAHKCVVRNAAGMDVAIVQLESNVDTGHFVTNWINHGDKALAPSFREVIKFDPLTGTPDTVDRTELTS